MPRKPDTMTESRSNQMSPETFLAAYRKIEETKRAKDEAAAAHKAARDEFRSMGGDLNAFKIVKHLQGLDDAEAELRMRETIRYAAWLGLEVGTQADMFGDAPPIDLTGKVQTQHREWEAEQKGYHPGKGGEPADNNPFSGGSPFHVCWRRGWHDGQAFLAAGMPPKEQ